MKRKKKLVSRIAELETEITQLKNKVDQLNEGIESLSNEVGQLKQKQQQQDEIMVIGECVRQMERKIICEVYGPDIPIYSLSRMFSDLSQNTNTELKEKWNKLKEEMNWEKDMFENIKAISNGRVMSAHPTTTFDGKPITKQYLEDLGTTHLDPELKSTFDEVIDILNWITPKDESLFKPIKIQQPLKKERGKRMH